ncbi:MAG TPA: hypothetical protein VGB38_08295, partial [bacterium]
GYGSTETTTTKYRNAIPMEVVVCRSCAASIGKKSTFRFCSLLFGVPFFISLLLFFVFHWTTFGIIASVITVLMLILVLLIIKDEKKKQFINPAELEKDLIKLGNKKASKLLNKPSTFKIGFYKDKSSGAFVMTPSDFQKLQEASKAAD